MEQPIAHVVVTSDDADRFVQALIDSGWGAAFQLVDLDGSVDSVLYENENSDIGINLIVED